MLGKWPILPKLKLGVVDIRDVSKAHLEAVLRDVANDITNDSSCVPSLLKW